jgi:hypothetical protein
MTPLERWKYSPPENEPATISDITRALANPLPRRLALANQLAICVRVRPVSCFRSSLSCSVGFPMKQSVNVSLMTPLERWKYSPPENEPATISDITRARARVISLIVAGSFSGGEYFQRSRGVIRDTLTDYLKQLTGLTRTQIANWFANARRRGKVRASPGTSSPVSTSNVQGES